VVITGCSLQFSNPKVDDDVAHVTFGLVPISIGTKVGEIYLKFGKMV
jgi:hypothetical protein